MEKIKSLKDKLNNWKSMAGSITSFLWTESERVIDKLRTFFISHLKNGRTTVDNIRFTSDHRNLSKGPGPKPIILRFT